MVEKVNPSHPDKIADRIAGAIKRRTAKKVRRYSKQQEEGEDNEVH